MTGSVAPRGVLAVLCTAQFVLILDVAVVNVALVPLAADLGADPGALQLVASVYAGCFGGALLIGGRLADIGRRRAVFVAGLALFAAGSAWCGAAWNVPALVAGRALQGLGAALASPAALSLLTTTFAEGGERERALGVWASVAAAGGAAGLVVGGVLADLTGWRSVFLVNLPVVAIVVVLAFRILPADAPGRGRVPVGAGLAAFGAVLLLVGGLGAVEAGAGTFGAGVLAAAAVAGVAFAVVDRRGPDPLLPPALVRVRSVLAANAVTALMSVVVLGVNFHLAVHLQARLGFGPVVAGLAFLPITLVSAVSAALAARSVTRLGPRPLLVAGMVAMAAGSALLARLPADGAYLSAVLPGMVLVAAGMGPGFAVGSIAATGGVAPQQHGAAAALLSTSTQVGAAVGLAGLGAVVAANPARGTVFAAMAIVAVLAAACALALPRATGARRQTTAPIVPAHAAGCLPGCVTASGAPAPVTTRRKP